MISELNDKSQKIDFEMILAKTKVMHSEETVPEIANKEKIQEYSEINWPDMRDISDEISIENIIYIVRA